MKDTVVFVDIPQNGSGAVERVCGLVEDLGGIGTIDEQAKGVTHLVTTYDSQSPTLKLARKLDKGAVFILSVDWVLQCHHQFKRLDEALYYMPASIAQAEELLNCLIERQSKCIHPLLGPMKVPVSEMQLNGLNESEHRRLNTSLSKSFMNHFEGRLKKWLPISRV